MTASQRLRHLDYEAKYGGYAEVFRRMDRQIEDAQLKFGSMQESVERMRRINASTAGKAT